MNGTWVLWKRMHHLRQSGGSSSISAPPSPQDGVLPPTTWRGRRQTRCLCSAYRPAPCVTTAFENVAADTTSVNDVPDAMDGPSAAAETLVVLGFVSRL